MVPHEGTPAAEHVPAGWRSKIMHARLSVRDKVLMGSDAPPDRYEPIKRCSVMVGIDEPAEAERIFAAPGGEWEGGHADPEDLLDGAVRHAGRSIRHTVDDQL
jgi:uncharacterized glyoxalase superfamily protein PhnB